jgi:hypothetical protein
MAIPLAHVAAPLAAEAQQAAKVYRLSAVSPILPEASRIWRDLQGCGTGVRRGQNILIEG